MALLRNRVIADVSYKEILRVDPNPICFLKKGGNLDTDRRTQGGRHVKMEAEMG